MAAEAANQASGLQELQRFMSHCAAVLGLPEPAMPKGAVDGGAAKQLIATAAAFQQKVGGGGKGRWEGSAMHSMHR
jgi:hypothetical protein